MRLVQKFTDLNSIRAASDNSFNLPKKLHAGAFL